MPDSRSRPGAPSVLCVSLDECPNAIQLFAAAMGWTSDAGQPDVVLVQYGHPKDLSELTERVAAAERARAAAQLPLILVGTPDTAHLEEIAKDRSVVPMHFPLSITRLIDEVHALADLRDGSAGRQAEANPPAAEAA